MTGSSAEPGIDAPLVSIGVPTYNRSVLLRGALDSLLRQDQPGIEIVVSDNASTDETPAVLAEFCARSDRIRTFRHEAPVPVPENFRTVLRMARGRYFMWASDDDGWEPSLVRVLAEHLEAHRNVALVSAEAQYVTPEGVRLPVIQEGAPWYGRVHDTVGDRLDAVARYNYGNLIYGLYRRDALSLGDGTVLDGWRSLNEIPVYLQVALAGDIQVLDQVLFYKTAPVSTYLAVARRHRVTVALRELPAPGNAAARVASPVRRALGTRRKVLKYHSDAARDCLSALAPMPIDSVTRARVTTRLMGELARNAAALLIRSDPA